ncbi:MAG: histidine phosphatase family protein [Solirubrobacterales bacterium]|nr:histidine phosphatase family protein [Solirubrobacterales bacterium]
MIYLARHGQTAYNLEGRFQGWGDVPLDQLGREQARQLAVAVAGVEPVTLVSSNIARALETATIVSELVGLELQIDPRFAETETGEWTDRSFAEVAAEDPEAFAAFVELQPDWGFPGGESFATQAARVAAGLDDWRARSETGPTVIICHGNVIRLALRDAGRDGSERPDNGSMVAL